MKKLTFTALLKRTPKELRPFLKEIKQELDFKKVPLYIHDVENINDNGEHISGYFGYIDRYEPEINVAVKKPLADWLSVFIHEYNHFKQWEDNCKVWKDGYIRGADSTDLLDLWFSKNIELTKKQVNNVVDRIFNIESDCEIKTVALIQKHNIPIDIKKYIKEANSYLIFHETCKHLRRWFKSTPPYSVEKLNKLCPDDEIYKSSKDIKKVVLKQFIKYYKNRS